MRIDQVKVGVQDVRLCDDGTMDTVVEWWCQACQTWHEIRYDGEAAAGYRDESGALNLLAFANEVVLDDIESEPAHWIEKIGERHLMYSMPHMMRHDICEACLKERPDDKEEPGDGEFDWLDYFLDDGTPTFHAWEVYSKALPMDAEPLRVTLCPECAERMADGVTQLFVNVYLEDQAYGGPEEGGWWYIVGSIERVYPVSCLQDAYMLARFLEGGEFSNEGRPSMYHTNSDGEYRVRIQLQPGQGYPTRRPHYE